MTTLAPAPRREIAFPLRFDGLGRTAGAGEAEHVRQMIEQLLFTAAGERVNRPDFGGGVLQAVFGANSPELATAMQFTIRAALQRWLDEAIEVQALEVTAEGAALTIVVGYVLRRTGDRRVDSFTREVPA